MTIDELFDAKKKESPDLSEHMDTLRRYAARCQTVTEFGVRGGCSTAALLAGLPLRMTSYDIAPFADLALFKQVASDVTYFVFRQQDDCSKIIEPTDLLFIDTIHTFEQLDKELTMHSDMVKDYIIFHDTHVKPSEASPENDGAGMRRAIAKLIARGKWRVREDRQNQNGLTVLERIAP